MNVSVSQLVKCPQCGHRFELSETFRAHYEQEKQAAVADAVHHMSVKAEAAQAEREEAIRAEAQAQHEQQLADSAQRQESLQAQLRQQQAAQEELQEKFAKEQAEREEREAEIRQQVERQQQAEREEAAQREAQLREQLSQERAERERSLQEQLAKEQAERELREVQWREELQRQQKAEQEKVALREKAHAEEIRRLNQSLADLQRKTGQGSMELQGEALETLLRDRLREAFPLDHIQDVGKGVTGADLRQSVINNRLQDCGAIVWEAKDTKHWGKDWIDKIKTDAALAGAPVRVIVSRTLPKGVDVFDLVEGVWVCSIHAALSLATALRLYLIESQRLQQASQGQGTKMEAIYAYLTSPLFRDRIQQIVDTYQSLKDQVSKERRAMESQWRTREKQLDRLISTTIEFRSDLEAVIGRDMLAVPGLELEALPPAEEASTTDPSSAWEDGGNF